MFQTLATLVPGGIATGATTASPFGVGLLSLAGGNVDLLISALESKGLARRLAEPDLVALSGDTASFLAGGEYPVPSVQSSSGTAPIITTEYKPYGVQLSFVPTVLASGIINLRLNPSVSELDYKDAVVISGTSISWITKRETRTTIELRDGQSFAIAGLLQSDNSHDVINCRGSVRCPFSACCSAASPTRRPRPILLSLSRLTSSRPPRQGRSSRRLSTRICRPTISTFS